MRQQGGGGGGQLRLTRRGHVVLGLATLTILAGGLASLSTFEPAPRVDAAGIPTPSATPTASTPSPSPSPTPSPEPEPLAGPAEPRLFDRSAVRLDLDPERPTHAAARAFFAVAPTVVVTDSSAPALDVGTMLAVRYRAPLLVAGPGLETLLTDLDAATALTVGEVGPLPLDDVRPVTLYPTTGVRGEPRAGADPGAALAARRWGLHRLHDIAVTGRSVHGVDPSPLRGTGGSRWRPADDAATVLVPRDDEVLAAAAVSAVAAGHRVVAADPGDPRADDRIGVDLADADLSRLVLLGSGDEWEATDPASLPWQLEVARSGQELPGGGQLVFPGRRFVALYGSPGTASLGVLGEQPVEAALERAVSQARAYQRLSNVAVVPTFEIIATIASSSAGADGDYSRERSVADLEPWVDAAERAGLYVVLDLQPGRTDFLTQARRFESLLARPHVGLALDPEWRLRPTERHLTQIGGVEASEVNEVSDWLATLVRRHALPQKLLIVHQFKLSMIRDRPSIVTRPELATVIQMDGQGGQAVKLDTWRAIRRDAPTGVWWGWKNFHDEDRPMRGPAETMALDPVPVFISYQ